MSVTISAAVNAYASTAGATQATRTRSEDVSGNFSDLLKSGLGAVQEKGRQADEVVAQAVNGKADILQVVTAVAETELAMETLVSVRDRVIGAYEEIMRMPI